MTRLVTVLGPVFVLAAGYAVGGQATGILTTPVSFAWEYPAFVWATDPNTGPLLMLLALGLIEVPFHRAAEHLSGPIDSNRQQAAG